MTQAAKASLGRQRQHDTTDTARQNEAQKMRTFLQMILMFVHVDNNAV